MIICTCSNKRAGCSQSQSQPRYRSSRHEQSTPRRKPRRYLMQTQLASTHPTPTCHTFTPSNSGFIFQVPFGVSTLQLTIIGGGGGGASGASSLDVAGAGGGGGGGGAFLQATVDVTAGEMIAFQQIGKGGAGASAQLTAGGLQLAGSPGQPTIIIFPDGTTVTSDGGQPGQAGTAAQMGSAGGAGGQFMVMNGPSPPTVEPASTVLLVGTTGANGVEVNTTQGGNGGGGGAAGTATPTILNNFGHGGISCTSGTIGTTAGSGGGGGGGSSLLPETSGVGCAGGAGADGQIVICF